MLLLTLHLRYLRIRKSATYSSASLYLLVVALIS